MKDGRGSPQKNTSELAEESEDFLVIRTARWSREDLIKVEHLGAQFGWYRGRRVFRPIYGDVYVMKDIFCFSASAYFAIIAPLSLST